jgi:biofilm PGA synthesis N-glycosyltransferase PgaC
LSVVHLYLEAIETSAVYWTALFFFAFYPIGSSVMWTVTTLTYYARREFRKKKWAPVLEQYPAVSVLIPSYYEELHIEETITSCLLLDYPDFEVVVVDDGSADRTVEKVLPYVAEGRVRLIAKTENEGKAMALNDAIPCLRGEIVVVIDADSFPEPEMLRYIVPHFSSARVAAVTGNPRVIERDTFLAKLQTIEFTSIVSILRRAQRVWGRILTVSGVATAFRKSALVDVGLFSPDMATEDIDMTWKLQMRYYDVRYEPAKAATRPLEATKAMGSGPGAGSQATRQGCTFLLEATQDVADLVRGFPVDTVGLHLRVSHHPLGVFLRRRLPARGGFALPELVGHADRYPVHRPARHGRALG